MFSRIQKKVIIFSLKNPMLWYYLSRNVKINTRRIKPQKPKMNIIMMRVEFDDLLVAGACNNADLEIKSFCVLPVILSLFIAVLVAVNNLNVVLTVVRFVVVSKSEIAR